MARSIVSQSEQYGLPERVAHPHEFKPYVDAPEYCSQELYETGDTCNRPAEDHEPHHREARQLPPTSEVSDLLAGPRIMPGLMKRASGDMGGGRERFLKELENADSVIKKTPGALIDYGDGTMGVDSTKLPKDFLDYYKNLQSAGYAMGHI